jgi:hypothetical protein|nr:MAG TPA: hypothetical protein [Caudoviricetes sp.]
MKKLIQLKNKENEKLDPINKNYEQRISSLEGVVLYEHNGSGATDNITLSDSAANYKFIEIFYNGASNNNYVKVCEPNNKQVFLTTAWTNTNDSGNLKIAIIYISNKLISKQKYTAINYSANSFSATEENGIGIKKVIGYK